MDGAAPKVKKETAAKKKAAPKKQKATKKKAAPKKKWVAFPHYKKGGAFERAGV